MTDLHKRIAVIALFVSSLACTKVADGPEGAEGESETNQTSSSESGGSETTQDPTGDPTDDPTDDPSTSAGGTDPFYPPCDCAPDELCVADCAPVPGVTAPPISISVRCVALSDACEGVDSCETQSFDCMMETCGPNAVCDNYCYLGDRYDVSCTQGVELCSPYSNAGCVGGVTKCNPALAGDQITYWCGQLGTDAVGEACTLFGEGEDSCEAGSLCWDRVLEGGEVSMTGTCVPLCEWDWPDHLCAEEGQECVWEDYPGTVDAIDRVGVCRPAP